MNKLSLDSSKYYRVIEKLLSRDEFFSKIGEDLGLIALILDKYANIPHSLREIDVEEAFEKAEMHITKVIDKMLEQKKLAEDIGFEA